MNDHGGGIKVSSPQTKWAVVALVAGCAASIAAAPGAAGAFGACLFVMALAVAIVDWRRLIIPDWMNAIVFALGLAQAAVLSDGTPITTALAAALARGATLGGVLLIVKLAYARARGREGLGLGDVKLAGAGGAWVAWTGLPIIIEIAALSAIVVFLVGPRLAGRQAQWDARLPFGSFLAPAIWATWLIQTIYGA